MVEAGSGRSAAETLRRLRTDYPESPFLALGQTVFWDEPVKAALRSLLDQQQLGGELFVGVHDTDYFAKASVPRTGAGRFALLPHNDGSTKTLWSAAGEISTLFGSETYPSRHDYVRAGVPFRKLAATDPEGSQAFLDRETEAWGWRGLVYTGSRDLIVCQLRLHEVGSAVLDMLRWGFRGAVAQVMPDCCRKEAGRTTGVLLEWCESYIQSCPDKTLSDLYQYLLPRLYALLLGYTPSGLTVTSTSSLLRLAPDTAALPRFRFLDLFLSPETRAAAMEAYNRSVAGSEIYTLDRFGDGALPFDCLLPDRGRGTLRVTPRVLFVETRNPLAIRLDQAIETVQDLAAALARRYPEGVAVVGKAVSLISMLAQEFLFVFSEEGSGYVHRTREMHSALQRAGIPLDMRPILRLKYETWNAMKVAGCTLQLPEHLAAAAGREEMPADEFGRRWQELVRSQRSLLNELAGIRKPCDLLSFLGAKLPHGPWRGYLDQHASYRKAVASQRIRVEAVQQRVHDLYAVLRRLRKESASNEEAMGEHFRSVADWTDQETARREEFRSRRQELARLKADVLGDLSAARSERRSIERGEAASHARREINRIEREAECARLAMARAALLTTAGLPHTNHRPSAWWLAALDSSGGWFREVVQTAALYEEPLVHRVQAR